MEKLKGSGIIYLKSRKKTEEFHKKLQKKGFKTDYYHAGMGLKERKTIEQKWLKNEVDIVISTSAFGMGIDKSDVRYVIHLDIPANLEEYYQESGRAGRDGNTAEAIILYNQEDIEYQKLLMSFRFPTLETIKHIYTSLGNFYQLGAGGSKGKGFIFDIHKFSRRFDLKPQLVHHAIKILESEGYLLLSESTIITSSIKILVDRYHLENTLREDTFYSKVLDLILRSYTGLFNDHKKISESFLAEKLNTSDHSVKNALQILEKKNLIHYHTPSFLPRLIYTEERIHSNHLELSQKSLKQRKLNAEAQLYSILKFVEEPFKCRTNIALFYFNEIPESDCGHCDNCLKNKTQKSDKKRLTEIAQSGKTLPQIISESPFSKEDTIQTIRILLDEGKLVRKGNEIFGS